ncbi:hypothetical protein FPV67DRAFT_1198377 [Lyophyllum atratum]|nr:hypothetical protein FPV67DRAFT_1198377 [Lyophyllum atratum]
MVHPCLLMPEILNHICKTLHACRDRPYKPNSPNCKDLAAMALTCRAFVDPANDYIWSEMDTMAPIVKCMPADLWTEVGDDLGTPWLEFSRAIIPSDIKAFTEKSHRLKHLSISTEATHPVAPWTWVKVTQTPPEIFSALHAAAKTTLLFPNVASLAFSHPSPLVLMIVYEHTGPYLTELSLDERCDLDSKNDYPLIRSLPRRYPALRSLEISNVPSDLVSTMVRDLPHLQRLKSHGMITSEAIHHLMSLPDLHTLSSGSSTMLPLQASTLPSFQTLSSLTFRCHSAEDAVKLLSSVTSPKVRWIGLQFMDRLLTPEEWDNICSTLATCPARTSVETVWLDNSVPDVDADELLRIGSVSFNVIRHILVISDLLEFGFKTPLYLDFDDACLEELARAFPSLSELDLAYDGSLCHQPRATLAAISALAEHCPHLCSLSISIDARDKGNILPSPALPNDSSIFLSFSNSPISDAQWVAFQLADIFPNIRSVNGSYDPWPIDDPLYQYEALPPCLWSEVLAFVQKRAMTR